MHTRASPRNLAGWACSKPWSRVVTPKPAAGVVTDTPAPPTPPSVSSARLWIAILLPVLLLAGVMALIVRFDVAERFRDPAAPPTELVSVQRVLLKPEGIVATVLNESPQEVTIAQVAVDDAYWQFTADPG